MKASMDVSADELGRIGELYDRGMYLQAWQASTRVGPLREWRGTSARVLAGRLAGNLGAQRLGRVLHFRAWRDDREDLEALYSYAYAILDRRGPLDAWVLLRAGGDFAAAPEPLRADLYALRAEVAALLRDFDTADHWLGRAEKIAADRAWFHVARARILEHEDRYPDALAAVRRALELRPWYRPAVQTWATSSSCSTATPRPSRSCARRARRIESGAVAVQLAALEVELATTPRRGSPASGSSSCRRCSRRRCGCGSLRAVPTPPTRAATMPRPRDGPRRSTTRSTSGSPSGWRGSDRRPAGPAAGRLRPPAPHDLRAGDAVGASAASGAWPAEHLAGRGGDLLRRHARPQRAAVGGAERLDRPRVHRHVGGRPRAHRPRHPVHAHDRRARAAPTSRR